MSNDTQVQAHIPPLPFAVFDEFGQGCEDRVADHYLAAVEASARQLAEQPGFVMVPLTDEQIWASDEIMAANGTVTQLPMDELRAVVRAVEATHRKLAAARPLTASPTAPSTEASEPVGERGSVNPIKEAIEPIVAKMRADLEAVGGFENELLSVPAGGVRNYIEALETALQLLKRYVSETPLGHQPHMIAEPALAAITSGSAALAALRSMPAEPLFLLHTGHIDSDGEQYDWDVEADSGARVDAFCKLHPGQEVKLYATLDPASVTAELVACQSCGIEATREVPVEADGFPGPYCDECGPGGEPTPPPAPVLSDAEIEQAVKAARHPSGTLTPTDLARAIEQAIGRASMGAK